LSFDPVSPQRPGLWEAWTPWQLAVFALLLLGANLFWQVLFYQGAAILAVLLPCGAAAWWHGQSFASAFDLRRDWRNAGLGALAGALAWAPAGLLAEFSARLRPPSEEYLAFLQSHLPDSPLEIGVAFLAAVVAAPVAEELIFRGLLFRLSSDRWGFARGLVLTSLFFGIAHGEPWSLFGLVGLGALLAALYRWTGSLTTAVAAHAVHNAISLVLLLRWRGDLETESITTPGDWALIAASTALLVLLLWRLAERRR